MDKYIEIANDGTGDIDDDHLFDESKCDQCERYIGAHLIESYYNNDIDVPHWTMPFRAPNGSIICEDCIPKNAEIEWCK